MPFRKAATERSGGEGGKKGERKEEKREEERREGGRKEQKKNNKEKFETSMQRLVPGKPGKPGFVSIMSQQERGQYGAVPCFIPTKTVTAPQCPASALEAACLANKKRSESASHEDQPHVGV